MPSAWPCRAKRPLSWRVAPVLECSGRELGVAQEAVERVTERPLHAPTPATRPAFLSAASAPLGVRKRGARTTQHLPRESLLDFSPLLLLGLVVPFCEGKSRGKRNSR